MLYIWPQKGPLINLIVKYVTIMVIIERILIVIYPLQNTKCYQNATKRCKKGPHGFVLNVKNVITIVPVTIGT